MPDRSSPWGAALAGVAAVILAAPTVLLPADGPTGPKVVFAVVGAVLFVAAVVATRKQPGARTPAERVGRGPEEELSPPDPGPTPQE